MFDSLRKWLGGEAAAPAPTRPAPPPDPEPVETTVPEMTVEDLRTRQSQEEPFLVVDVREGYEWQQVHLPANIGFEVLHIPMNSIPERLDDLPRDRPLAILCAHGNRSYGVTHFLVEQGFQASNISGGITRWAIAGGEVARG